MLSLSKHSERLVYEELTASHAPEMYASLADPQATTYIPQMRPSSLDELHAKYARLESRRSPDGADHWLNWIVRRRTDAVLVGFLQATISAAAECATIGYVVFPFAWRNGYATESVRVLLAAIAEAGIPRVRAIVDERNIASRALIERLRFRAADREPIFGEDRMTPIAVDITYVLP